ncbi:MAG: ATP-binding protein [Deltaproteobacteria bacterium]|nr:ATP-binding protein [Deltaproteobacteria bacterium]
MEFDRVLLRELRTKRSSPLGLLLFGPRQVGKTSLLTRLLEGRHPWIIQLQDYEVFQTHLTDAGAFKRQVLARLESATPARPLVIMIDEIQKLPRLLDDCQWLLDQHRDRVRLHATGSSARKLRREGVNLLPGRVRTRALHPLLWREIVGEIGRRPLVNLSAREPPWAAALAPTSRRWPVPWTDMLGLGTLPGVLVARASDRVDLLRSYTLTYLREEIQAEALVRSLEGFSRFLEIAAAESGNATNFQKLGSEVGLTINTVKNYYSILLDTLVAVRLEPYTKNARRRLALTPKLYLFDLGVRNAAAGLPIGPALLRLDAGRLFEHWVVLEMIRRISYFGPGARVAFWRTSDGSEVDLVLDLPTGPVPIEIKWASRTASLKLSGLHGFMRDHGCRVGYVVGNFSAPERLDRGVLALPWWWL